MNKRNKIIAIGLAVLIIFSGVIYAKNKSELPETKNKFEITENVKPENKESEVNNGVEMPKELAVDQKDQSEKKEQKAVKIDFEKLMAAHPETKSIYQEYKVEKENIKGEENEKAKLKELKKNYYPFILEKVESDLKKFAEKNEIKLLMVEEKAVVGQKPEKELENLEDKTDQFIEFLAAK